MFICGAPLETKAGSENLKVDLAKAKQLLKEGGYAGERIVLMDSH